MDLLLAAEMSWEPWIGLATIVIALVAALVAFASRLTTVEVTQKSHEKRLTKVESTVFSQPNVVRYRREQDDSETA